MKAKITAQDRADFAQRVREVIRQADGRTNPDTGDLYEYILDWTRVGPLYLHVSDSEKIALGFVAGRFLHPGRAVDLMGSGEVNKHSGKWNHHYWGGSVDEAITAFGRSLLRIIPFPEGWPGLRARHP